jgi:hypothetical protein
MNTAEEFRRVEGFRVPLERPCPDVPPMLLYDRHGKLLEGFVPKVWIRVLWYEQVMTKPMWLVKIIWLPLGSD